MLFFIYISLLVIQRLSELSIAKKNEQWVRAQGAIEYGREHYPYIVALHTLFFVSMIAEYIWRGGPLVIWLAFVLVVLLMAFKYWTLASLGKYWNTKILRVPGASPGHERTLQVFKASQLHGGNRRNSAYSVSISTLFYRNTVYCFKCRYALCKDKG